MPNIFLSPSTQEYNLFVNGGTEEEYMNLITDALEPYLRFNGIMFSRNTPQMTAASSIIASNEGNYDLHVAIHSNASAPAQFGQNRGSIVFFYPSSAQEASASGFIANHLREIYPLPELVNVQSATNIGELSRTRAPATFLEVAFHDNIYDATWIKDNIEPIARAIANGITDHFGLPFLPVGTPRSGRVDTQGGALNLRSLPSRDAAVLAHLYDGAMLTILNEWMGWYVVEFGNLRGFVAAEYVTLL